MAKKKNNRFDDEYDLAYQQHVVIPDQHFTVVIPATPLPTREISEYEAQRRALCKRYKAVFGFKPVEKNLDVLRQLVEDAERR
jgi:hypothetical protein